VVPSAFLHIHTFQMSSVPIDSIPLLAEAILCLGAGKPLPSIITDALRALLPAAAASPEPVVEPVVEASPPAKEKKIRKTTAAAAAASAAASAAAAAEPVAEPVAVPAAVPAAANGGDPWRAHPSRLAAIDPKCCMGRRIDEKNPLAGTCPGDVGAKRGKVFPEKQCNSEPVPGSKLCAGCAAKDAAFKANPNTKDESWYGRLDEESLYPRAKIVGCKYFLDKYPNGIHNDSFRPGAAAAAAAVTAATATATAAATPKKRGPKKAATATATAAAETVAVPAAVTSKTVAVDIAPVNATYKSFMHEGRLHIRNLETNKVYYANISKDSPEENAVKEQYVGRWVDNHVDLIGDSDSDDEA
jgi:hypothetical protein